MGVVGSVKDAEDQGGALRHSWPWRDASKEQHNRYIPQRLYQIRNQSRQQGLGTSSDCHCRDRASSETVGSTGSTWLRTRLELPIKESLRRSMGTTQLHTIGSSTLDCCLS